MRHNKNVTEYTTHALICDLVSTLVAGRVQISACAGAAYHVRTTHACAKQASAILACMLSTQASQASELMNARSP